MADTTVLERFEQLEDLWPGGAMPSHAILGTGTEQWVGERSRRRDPLGWMADFFKSHRLSIIAVGVLGGLIAWLLVGVAPAIGEGIAESQREKYQTALANADEAISVARAGLALAIDPEASALSDALAPLTDFSVAAADLAALAGAPLPDVPPLVTHRYVTELIPEKEALAATAARAQAASERLNGVVAYRLLMQGAFVLPTLPVEALATDIDQLGGEIALMLVETGDSIARLPAEPTLDSVTVASTEALARFEAWRSDYLTALTTGDVQLAQQLADDARTWIADIEGSLETGLSGFDEWARLELDELRVEILEAVS